MAGIKMKRTDVVRVRTGLLKKQNGICPLCNEPIEDPVLDHCHTTGFIRGVLCRNCNGIEGQITNRINRAKRNLTQEQWLENYAKYRRLHVKPQTNFIHHTFKTPDDKKLILSKKRRSRRANAKALGDALKAKGAKS